MADDPERRPRARRRASVRVQVRAQVRARVRERGIGRLEIHKRGVPISPDTVRTAVHPRGEACETWIMTRIGPRGESGERARGAVIVAQSCEAVPPAAEEPVSVS